MVISIVKGYDESERLRRSDSSICMADARHGQRVVNDILALYHNVLFDTAIFQLLSLLETNGRNGKPRFTEEWKNIVYNADKHRTAADLLTKDVVAIMIQTTSSFEWRKTILGMVTSMGIRHAMPYTLRGGPLKKLEQ
ncbi:hypothetical protein Tco_1331469, partial [Tanacetum coccineum]